ncbi:hypothetical protein HX793_25745 [Pseudomonas reactans]|uniref:hypothetical protein n=1 Tax=Pseudomonas reactans TaxID=117680 RepID=UPI0015C171FE|nr:hypothetical protein [Pseudomonas reactans]NWD33198.1 hypothetical protein [Pseudomonas reactans]
MESQEVFKQFVPYIFGTGLVTVGLTLFVDKIFLFLNNQKEKKYSSIRVAVILESYALSCSEFISGNEYYGQRYSYDERSYELTNGNRPRLVTFPSDINWKEVNPSLASKALSIYAEELMTDSLLANLTDDENGWDELWEVHKIVGYNGYKAWMLANEFRASASLPRAETLHFEKYVEKHLHPFYKKSVDEANYRKKSSDEITSSTE